MLNTITIMGRLTADPELRRTGSGIAVASFRVAVDRDFASKEGGEKKTDFINCVAWRATGEFVSKYFRKGSRRAISASLPRSTLPMSISAKASATAPALSLVAISSLPTPNMTTVHPLLLPIRSSLELPDMGRPLRMASPAMVDMQLPTADLLSSLCWTTMMHSCPSKPNKQHSTPTGNSRLVCLFHSI